jgi:hypothetical protein
MNNPSLHSGQLPGASSLGCIRHEWPPAAAVETRAARLRTAEILFYALGAVAVAFFAGLLVGVGIIPIN